MRLDSLEPRVVPGAMALDMDTATSPTMSGYTRAKVVKYTATNHSGWEVTTGLGAMNRASGNALLRDFHYGKNGTYLADVANGEYDVVVGLGDAATKRDFMSVWAEGTLLAADVTTQKNQFLEVRGRVTVSDGRMSIRIADAGGSSANFAVTHVRIISTDPAAGSLWPDTTLPTVASAADTASVELGLRFQSDLAGFINGVRFYKGPTNTGTHVGHLWAPDGTLLATATFASETATGWQQVLFDTPVAIQPNQTYTVSYMAPNGGYAFDSYYFSVSGIQSGSLKVLPTSFGGGGTFKYGGGYPTETYQDGNYWVDVVFAPGSSLPTANAGVDKSANEAASVSFTGTAGGGTGALSYHWDFGDGGTADGTLTPSHTYADNGSYTVTLTVTDGANQTATDTATVTVNNVAPTATLSNNGPVNTNATVTISFANQDDVSAPDETAGFKYSYDFDNNGTWEQTDVTSASATTSYAASGSKTVKARIKDKDGGFTDYTTVVTVNGPLTANAGADKTANEASSVAFTGTAGGGVGTLTYSWDFGDGGTTTGTLTPSHTYADNGSYTVTLTVTDGASSTATDTAVVTVNNVAPTATLSNNGPLNVNDTVTISFGSQDDVSAPDKTAGFKYSYDFDNNGTWELTDVTSSSATTSYTTAGSKTVKGRIKDKDGGFTDYTTAVTVNAALTANAGADKTANEASSVAFTGTTAGGTGTKTYSWDFGDGGTATGTLTPSHTFADNGSYTVTLTVTDGTGDTATDTAVVTVNNVAPTATLSNNGPVNTNATVTISFANQDDVSAPDETAGFKYSYDFDNNGTWEQTDVTSASATTSYAASGSKTVKARIKDKDGGFTDYTTTFQVNNPTSSGLVASFGFDEGSGTTVNSSAGSGMNGTISGATWVAGKSGNALSFDGVDDWVTVPHSTALDLTTGMTLEAWVRLSGAAPASGWTTILFKERPSVDGNYALDGQMGNNLPGVGFNTAGGDVLASAPNALALNTWTHLAATYDGSSVVVYVNGVAVTTKTASGAITTSVAPLRIGGNSLFGEYFNGLIDEVRIYNRALSASEITADMNPAPTVTAVSPANGATGVLTTTTVTVTFSSAMDATTINTDTILLKTAGGSVVPATVTYNATNQRATLTPNAALSLAATYTVLVEGGTGTAVKDTAGKAMAADFTSTFTTTDGSPPTANAGPDKTANEGAAVSFSGSSTGGTGQKTYRWDFGDGTSPVTGTLTPSHTFADNGSYTVTLTVTDEMSNTATDTAVVTVNNVAPTATLSNNGPVNPNNTVTISFTGASDAAADVTAGFKYSYDFDNNGTWEVTDSTAASATTSYSTTGDRTVKGRIKDKDGAFTDYTTIVQVTNAQAPLAPTGLAAKSVSASEVNLTWDLGDATDTAVVIERKTGAGGTYQTLTVLPGGENIYTDTSGWASTTYFYRVKARNAQGDSGWGPEKSATTSGVGTGTLNLVSNLTAVAQSPTTVRVSFTDTNSGFSPNYLVERSDNGLAYQVVSVLSSGTATTDEGLTPGTTYWYRVRATSWSKPTSDYTPALTVTTPTPIQGTPVAPSRLEAIALSGTSVKLTWVNNAAASTQFKIERASFNVWGSQSWSQIAVTAAGATSFTDTGLTAERPYIYRVRATNATGDSTWAPPASDIYLQLTGEAVPVVTASAGTGSPKTYNIGPGQTYATLNSLDWSIIGPGDTVNIHYKPGGYHEILQIAVRGTPAAWITIRGIPDPTSGALPVIDGANAVLATQFQNHYAPLNGSGAVLFGTRPGYVAGYKPGYIVLEKLQIQGAYKTNQFTDFNGTVKNYGDVGAGIYLERADNILIKGNVVADNGEGIFGAGQSGFDRLMANITIDSNHIYGNGNIDRFTEHNTYLEGFDTIYQFNRFGPLRSGSGGAGLKDRSVGTIIRYNFIEGGDTQLQLPEAQNQMDLAMTIPRYRQMWVYGNTLVTPPGNPNAPVWYGGDQGLEPLNRKGVLYFYNNTVVIQSTQSEVFKINVLRTQSRGEAVDARNNIIAAIPHVAGAAAPNVGLLSGHGNGYFGRNWVSAGYQMTSDNAGFSGQAGGTANLFGTGQNPGFVNAAANDFHLAAGSAAIDGARRYAGYSLPVAFEFVDPHTGEARSVVGPSLDLGAFEFGN